MRELFVKRCSGEVIDFDRVFVETTGLADPIPVLHTLPIRGIPMGVCIDEAAAILQARRVVVVASGSFDH